MPRQRSEIPLGLFDRLEAPTTWHDLCERWEGCRKCNFRPPPQNIIMGAIPMTDAERKVCIENPDYGFDYADVHERCIRGMPPEVVALAQAPGKNEDKIGLPFQGIPGRVTLDWLTNPEHMGVPTWNLFLTNILACKPTESETGMVWRREWVRNCSDRVDHTISILKPKLVIAMGQKAGERFGMSGRMDDMRGRIIHYKNTTVICCTFPAMLCRQQTEREKREVSGILEEDFAKARRIYTQLTERDQWSNRNEKNSVGSGPSSPLQQ